MKESETNAEQKEEIEKLNDLTTRLDAFLQSIRDEFTTKQMAFCLLEGGSYLVYRYNCSKEEQEAFIAGCVKYGREIAEKEGECGGG